MMQETIHILMIHDDPAAGHTIRDVLENGLESVRIDEVYSRSRFRQALAASVYDIVLSGASQGSFTGREVIRDLRETGSDIPIILLQETATDRDLDAPGAPGQVDSVGGSSIHLKRLPARIVRIIERKKAEQAIHNQASWQLQRYRHIVDATDDFMAFVDANYIYCAVNQRYLDGFQKGWDEVVGHSVAEIIGADQFENGLKENIDRCMGGERCQYECWIDFPGLGNCLLDISYTPHVGSDGTVTGVIIRGHDLTSQRQAEDAMREGEERLRQYFDAGLVGMAIYSLEDGWVQINDYYCEIVGYSREELVQMTWADFTHPDDREMSAAQFKRILDGEIDRYSMEKRCVRKDGETIYIRISTECSRKKDGTVDYLVGFVQDITEQKKAEQALRRSEQLLRSYYDAGLVGMGLSRPDKGVFQFNDTFCEIMGYPRSELETMTWEDLTHPDDRAACTRQYERVMAGEIDNYSIDKRCVRKDGKIIHVTSSSKCVRKEDGTVEYLVTFVRDITERKLAEEALFRTHRALQVLNECNHSIVHATSGQELINTICRIIVETGGYRFTWVGYAQSNEDRTVYPVASAGYEAGYLDNDFSWREDRERFEPVSEVVGSGKAFIVRDIAAYPVYGSLKNAALERGYRSEIALPLNVGGKAFGALMIYASEADTFDHEEEKLLVRLADDLAYGILSVHTSRKHERAEQALRDSENRYRYLYDENPAMFFTVDTNGMILTVNKFGAQGLGYEVDELTGTSIFDLSYGNHKQLLMEFLQTCLETPGQVHYMEQQKVRKDGSVLWVKEAMRAVADSDGERSIFIVCEDITETRKFSEQLSYQASHDSLTDLINRGAFEKRLKKLLDTIQIDDSQHALCYLDLDQFKIVNDTCGHLAGDELLRQLGMLLQQQIRQRDTVARLGGDEFAILMEHCPVHRAELITGKLIQSIVDFQFIWEDRIFKVGVSAGLVPINRSSGNITEILKNADTACYTAKRQGRNSIHVYGKEDEGYIQKHGEIRWVSQIYTALEKDRFRLYFQSIVPLHNSENDIERYEVLVRMETENGDLIMPDLFMPAAEHYNLSTRIDRWVISTLFGLVKDLSQKGYRMPQYSINLSGHSIGDEELLNFIIQQFEISHIQPESICFEITETVAISNLTSAMRFINTLRDLGCLFALDDFGSGLSSFAYLKNLRVDYLKIDGLFIRDITTDPVNLAIVKSMLEVGKALGKQTVAEYVENKNVLNMLRDIGVDYAQGSYVCEELSFEEMARHGTSNIIELNERR